MMEAEPRQKVAACGETMQIGKSRPPLPLTDLPELEDVFALIFGGARSAADLSSVRPLGVGLLVLVFGITFFGRDNSRTLEIVNWFMVVFIPLSVGIIAILVVPGAVWGH